MKKILVFLFLLLALGAALTACQNSEWRARADIAQAQAAAAQANSAALQAQAKSAADIAGSQAGNINTALWAAALPGLLLLLVLTVVGVVALVAWSNIQRDRIRAEQARQYYMMQLLLVDNGTPARRQLTAAQQWQLPGAPLQPLQLPDPYSPRNLERS